MMLTAITLADVGQQHVDWILLNIGMMYCAIGGAIIRLLLVRGELLIVRLQNSIAGIILALILAPSTAIYFNQEGSVSGYAFIYGMVARELVVSFVDTVSDKVIPLYYRFLNTLSFNTHNKDDSDASNSD